LSPAEPGFAPAEQEALEDHFRRNGLPHLAADYDPREDTLTRLWPALIIMFVVGLAIALRPDWTWWQRVLAALAGGALALSALAAINLARRRPALARPEKVGFLETAVFVLTPAIASLASGDGPQRALAIGGVWVVIAAVFYVLTSMGVVPMLVHQWRPALSGLSATASVAVRALPPLLAVLLFLSLASETWRAFGRLEGWRFGALLIGFALLACVILVLGLARERRALYAVEPGPELEDDARHGPAAPLVARGVRPDAPPLSRLERINLAVALLLSLALRVVAVGTVVGAAFLGVALLVMDRELTAEWIQIEPDVLASIDIAGYEVVLTSAAVRVAMALGTFASLYFVAVALGDGRNREEFLDDELARLRRVMAAWAFYRGALRAGAESPRAGADGPGRGAD
jgi:hypothetical protein